MTISGPTVNLGSLSAGSTFVFPQQSLSDVFIKTSTGNSHGVNLATGQDIEFASTHQVICVAYEASPVPS